MELLSSIGLGIAVILVVLGADRVIRWMYMGYQHEQRMIRLGKMSAELIAEDGVRR